MTPQPTDRLGKFQRYEAREYKQMHYREPAMYSPCIDDVFAFISNFGSYVLIEVL